ncbi:MAG TPA: hypothetical protein VKP14_04270 [Gaiellaceae bacterium]|nr:hypothetical protein [Gaiellaceae bacterium]
MTIGDVLGEAFAVYRRLWRRSVVVAGLVSFVVSLAQALANRHATTLTQLVAVLLSLAGSLLVQGALVEVVRDLHEGRAPAPVGEYYERTRGRLGTLLGTALLYGLGAILIIPLARWALAVPLVVVERLKRRDAFARSSELVRGRTGRVLVLVLITYAISGVAALLISSAFVALPNFLAAWIGGTVAGAVAVPFQAHVLTVLYYRLTEPERPILPDTPAPKPWTSVWNEEPPA